MTDRRRRGTGTVEAVGDGFRFRCPDGSGGRFTSEVYATRPEAENGLTTFRSKVSKRELVTVGGLTLAEYWTRSWEPRKAVQRPQSIRTWRSVWKSQLSHAPFSRKPLASITKRDVKEWADRLTLGRPEHPVALLHSIFVDALESELVTRNPVAGILVRRKDLSERAESCPTPAEQAKILGCAAIPQHARSILAFALGSGLRPGEWRNLELVDVQMDAAEPSVMVRFGSAGGPTKGGRKRLIPLFGMALEALRAWMVDLPTFCPKNPLGLLFPQKNGRRRRASLPLGSVRGRDAWHVYRELAGITRDVRLHDMRHATATDLLRGRRGGRKWHPMEVQRLLGHHDFATTERFYLHLDDSMLFEAAADSGPSSVHGQSGAVPADVPKAHEAKAIATDPGPTSRLSPSSSESGERALQAVPEANSGSGWTDAGLIDRARHLLLLAMQGARIRPGEKATLARWADAVDAEQSTVRRTVARVLAGGPHQHAAFIELLDLLVPDAVPGQGAKSTRGDR